MSEDFKFLDNKMECYGIFCGWSMVIENLQDDFGVFLDKMSINFSCGSVVSMF